MAGAPVVEQKHAELVGDAASDVDPEGEEIEEDEHADVGGVVESSVEGLAVVADILPEFGVGEGGGVEVVGDGVVDGAETVVAVGDGEDVVGGSGGIKACAGHHEPADHSDDI